MKVIFFSGVPIKYAAHVSVFPSGTKNPLKWIYRVQTRRETDGNFERL
jgi:hypothetical protein